MSAPSGPPPPGVPRDSPWKKGLFKPLLVSAALLWFVFLADMSYLFGSTFGQRYRTHALHVLVVDLDGPGGAVSDALAASYAMMRGDQFPTLDFPDRAAPAPPPPKYADPASVADAVCRDGYWGAVYIHPGASSRLAAAVAGEADAVGYRANDTITYIYNQARYTPTVDSAIKANLEALITASRGSYYQTAAGRAALADLDRGNPDAVQAYLNPIRASSHLIGPTMQGSRAFYNTLNMVFPILLTFFFLVVANGVSEGHKLALRLRWHELWLFRFLLGKLYGLIAALVITGYVWAFREDWAVAPGVFATNWMIVWLEIDINWQVFDALVGTYLPLPYTSVFLVTWIVFNVTSAAFPVEIAPGFYRLSNALPGRNIYSLSVQAWTGCANQLKVALPVLFAWWLLGHIATVFAARTRCARAAKAAWGADPKGASPKEQPASDDSSEKTA